MDVLGIALLIAGTLAVLACKVWFLVIAFNESPAWGFACLIPFVAILFILTHFERTALNLGVGLASGAVFATGALLVASA